MHRGAPAAGYGDRVRNSWAIGAAVLALVGCAAAPAAARAERHSPGDDVRRAAEAVMPGTVYVQTQLPDGAIEAGTGMVLSPDGAVLTNYHLVRDQLTIGVYDPGDQRIHHAHLVGADPAEDVAVIAIEDARRLPTVGIARNPARVGQAVVAVGNGGGRLGEHVGHITATDRTLTATQLDGQEAETIRGLLETDARLTPGDSGGPLVASSGPDLGRVVGMDTAGVFARHGRRQTPVAAYAIPIERALRIAAGIVNRTARFRPARAS